MTRRVSSKTMLSKAKNHAFIDAANLYQGVKAGSWRLDYKKFRIWLQEKYNVTKAYLFIGFIPGNEAIYSTLRDAGFLLVYRKTNYDRAGKIKGNCDSDLVLKAVVDFYEKEFDQALIVSSDGDFAGLAKFLKEKNALASIVSPSNHCSFLLKEAGSPITYLHIEKEELARNP